MGMKPRVNRSRIKLDFVVQTKHEGLPGYNWVNVICAGLAWLDKSEVEYIEGGAKISESVVDWKNNS